MKLDYLKLLSPYPIYIKDVGNIIPPTLKKISEIGNDIYNTGLFYLLISKEDWIKNFGDKNFDFSELILNDKINIFDLWFINSQLLSLLVTSLSFYFKESIEINKENEKLILIDDAKKEIGYIQRDNFSEIINVIRQINNISIPTKENYKNEKAKKLNEKLKKHLKHSKIDENTELCNIISALCVKHNSINITNIWDLTIYQLYDQFSRLNYINQVNLAQHWSPMGEKDFNHNMWFENIKNTGG